MRTYRRTAMSRRMIGAGVLVLGGALATMSPGPSDSATVAELHVYKSPTCGCCSKWVDHIRAAGFVVTVEDVDGLGPVKERLGVPPRLASCHTAVVGDYIVEGHVPAEVIAKFLREAPTVRGIAVPGMPIGSPGMEGPRPQPYEVIAFDGNGNHTVYETMDPGQRNPG
ncbi:MAG: DUF411 domain-containing protein [Gemmatimonadetes bacterium]|nr:DUF411 domain-containing protein [Gemmatimonadota bacterium]